jgi:hypothetical protein
MSSEWVDANGDQWRFSTATGSWRKLVSGVWTISPLPAGGLQRVTTGTVTATITAPPWPEYDDHLDAPQWVDAQGDPWRQNPLTGLWQKLMDGTWVTSQPPYGGLRKIGEASAAPPDVVVVETMGPQGQKGERGEPGEPGLTYIAISEVLPAQLQNGVNDTFPLSDTADLNQAIQVFRNGLLEIPGLGYLVTQNSVTFTTPPLDSDVIAVIYQKAQ